MENIVVIASSDERTKKLLKHASNIAKSSGSKIWLIYDINSEIAEKTSDRNNRIGSRNYNSPSIPLKKPNRNEQANFHLNELKRNGIVAEHLFIERMNMKRFLEKVLTDHIIPQKPDFTS